MDTLVRILEQRQEKEGQSHQEFADRLGISRVHWSYLRHGKRQPGDKVRGKAIKAFPELGDIHVSLFLSKDVNKC